jgi:hypothetical protein
MTSYAAYLRDGRAPVLVRDGFSFWAFIFGPFWLLAHAAWIPAILLLALDVALSAILHGPASSIVGLGVAWLVGLHAQDLRGWGLTRRGWRLGDVVAAPDWDHAYARLLTTRPELQAAAAG